MLPQTDARLEICVPFISKSLVFGGIRLMGAPQACMMHPIMLPEVLSICQVTPHQNMEMSLFEHKKQDAGKRE